MSMPAGIQRLSSGSSSRMRSTVSMTLASACLVMTSSTEGWRLNQAAERLLRTPCSTEAMAESRTTVPFGGLDHERRVVRRRAQLVVGGDGVGALGAVEGAERAGGVGVGDGGAHVLHATPHRGERDRIDADADRRLLGAADADTSATPSTCDDALRDDACRRRRRSRSAAPCCEVSARIRIGAADGLALRKVGSVGRSPGRSVSAALSAACTSRAAPSMLRVRSNCMVMRVMPSELSAR